MSKAGCGLLRSEVAVKGHAHPRVCYERTSHAEACFVVRHSLK